METVTVMILGLVYMYIHAPKVYLQKSPDIMVALDHGGSIKSILVYTVQRLKFTAERLIMNLATVP